MDKVILSACVFFLAGSCWAQVIDSSHVAVPVAGDTSQKQDTTVTQDTLTAAQKLKDFEERHMETKRTQAGPGLLSFFDTLALRFATKRSSVTEAVGQSFYHDAGDYFRSNPGYFVLDYRGVPMRKIVKPYGIPGNRLGILNGDFVMQPFEHGVEPDGSIDMNDIPTALDSEIYILPGPLGTIFGADPSVATLFARPHYSPTGDALSALLVDKSGFGYSNTRGRYTRQFRNGRRIALAMGYRTLVPYIFANSDDSYNYDGDLYSPVGKDMGFRAVGHLYSRAGSLVINPFSSGASFLRHRYDRMARLSWIVHNQPHTAKYEFGYSYRKQQSNFDGRDSTHYAMQGKGLFLAREWAVGKTTMMKFDLQVQRLHYLADTMMYTRTAGVVTQSLVHIANDSSRGALSFGLRSADRFPAIPLVSASYLRESERFFLLISGGFSGREPSQDELFSPYRSAGIVYGNLKYANVGNPLLRKEYQLITSVDAEVGKSEQTLVLSLSGGRIFDAIQWRPLLVRDTVRFSPTNTSMNFATLTVRKKLHLADLVRFNAGASYHYVSKAQGDTNYYQPNFQLFSGLELHVYWPQRLIHLMAYGDVVYVGLYHGYQKEIGNYAVANARLSFQMARFHFFYNFQNVTGVTFEPRDNDINAGQIRTWGFYWNFLN